MGQPPPDPSPCWDGDWERVDGLDELWLLAALLRTVDALPRLHPWRLGDARGGGRILTWSAVRDDDPGLRPAYAVLAEEARDPELPAGEAPEPDAARVLGDVVWDLARDTAAEAGGAVAEAVGNALGGLAVRAPGLAGAAATVGRPATRWAGAVARLPGSWLPPLAVLPRAERGLDDPTTTWVTESAAFNARHTVHAADHRFAADVLAPHVMALLLDRVPDAAAVTVAGDALHVWWEHRAPLSDRPALLHRTVDAVRALAGAIPSFVLADHPDRSGAVEEELADRAEAAEEYRQQRRSGRSPDPVMQRIYDQARAAYGQSDVSSGG